MRRFFVILAALAALAAPAAALADRVGTPAAVATDGTASLTNASGTFKISGRGAVIGQIDRGSVKIVDPISTDGSGPIVTGAEHQRPLSDTTSLYSGTDVDFRIIGGSFTIVVSGSGIDLSFVGHGKVTLTGDAKALDDGKYSLDGGATYSTIVTASTTYTVGTP
jgi:hypothetical protein